MPHYLRPLEICSSAIFVRPDQSTVRAIDTSQLLPRRAVLSNQPLGSVSGLAPPNRWSFPVFVDDSSHNDHSPPSAINPIGDILPNRLDVEILVSGAVCAWLLLSRSGHRVSLPRCNVDLLARVR